MKPYTIHGIAFNADEEGRGAFDVFNPDSKAANDIAPYGCVEELKAFIRLTDGMKTFVDVGALFGLFSLVFTRNGSAMAYAVEPSPLAFPILKSHCDANPDRNIRPIMSFAGEIEGRAVKCFIDWKHVMANEGRSGNETMTLMELRLDDLIPFLATPVDCMKIDVEGYECQVLRGASALIKKCRPLIFLECHMGSMAANGETGAGLFSLITGMGYRLELSDGAPVTELGESSMTRVICYPV